MNDTKLNPVSDEALSAQPRSDTSGVTVEELQSYCDRLDQIIIQAREARACLRRMIKREKGHCGYFAFFRQLMT
jgi:hypothetical protein